jgi:penicillin-binding protein 1A
VSVILQAIYRVIAWWSVALICGLILAVALVLPLFLYFSRDLPDYHQLMEYDPPTITRIYTQDGRLMAELAKERRIFRSIDEIPEVVVKAFIAAEDQNYYTHPGIDISSIARAAVQNILNIGSDRKPVGGSTITQQVVKNFLLTNERSIGRKVREAILAYRINKVYSKSRILELYLNQIYLGNGAYGVTSAALAYFNKDLKYVTLEEAALLAALPKAPSNLDPTRHVDRVKPRRNWVIDRMLEEGFIAKEKAEIAKQKPIKLDSRFEASVLDNGYYTESTRLELIERYGYDSVYQNGLSVYTNINTELQKYADEALRAGLIEYDRKHGFAGPLKNLGSDLTNWQASLKQVAVPEAIGSWQMAVVLEVGAEKAKLGLRNGSIGKIELDSMRWARKRLKRGYVGKNIGAVSEVLSVGDVVLVSSVEQERDVYSLEQIPQVNGALVAMQPHTGKVLAMVGGYSFKESKYNRAIQALRQPGSAFKSFVYLTALEKGYAPTAIVRDEPISISQGPGKPAWTPKNFEGRVFLGRITMRKALEKSRNLATVHIVTRVGAHAVGEVAMRLGVYDKIPPAYYSMALGANETTLMKLTAAYATFASGGALIEAKLLDRVQDRKGNLIYTSDVRKCDGCVMQGDEGIMEDPTLRATRNYVLDGRTNYQLLSMLQGAVERGTAGRAKAIGKVVAGKTGTSNDANDTWFIGFSPDLVVGVFVGHDAPQSLGDKEQGASVALPIFVRFMSKALAKMPNKEFEVPEGIEFVDVDYDTGRPATFARRKVSEPVKIGAPEDSLEFDEGVSESIFQNAQENSQDDDIDDIESGQELN